MSSKLELLKKEMEAALKAWKADVKKLEEARNYAANSHQRFLDAQRTYVNTLSKEPIR